MLALDEPSELDEVVKQGNYSFCIDKTLLNQVQGVNIDFTYMGFAVDPVVSLGGGSSCSMSGGCSGCGPQQ